jgi:hypothetical protein
MSVRMDAPVVVKPDMVSKNASVSEGIEPSIINGREPNSEKRIHDPVTIMYPSLRPTEIS